MSGRLLVVSVTALLMVVAFAAVVAAAAPTAPARALDAAAVVPSLGTITVTPVDQNDNPTFTYLPGQTEGRVYFAIDDPGDDAQVTVNITDTNASRDGVSSPAATWVVNVSGGTYDSTQTGLAYTLPTTLVYGGNWTLNVSGAVGGTDSVKFLVQTYEVDLTVTPQQVLAGHTGTVQFYVTGIPSGTPYSEITSVNLTATYYDGAIPGLTHLNLSADAFGPGVTQGTATFFLPLGATDAGGIHIEAYANVTSSGQFSDVDTRNADIATVNTAYLSEQCACLNGNAAAANAQIQVTVTVILNSHSNTVGAGVNVSFSFASGLTPVANSAVPGNPPTNLTTNSDGEATILFLASPTVFSTTATDLVNVSVTALPSWNGSAPVFDNLTWAFLVLANGTEGATIVASFGAATYFSGEAGSATWSVLPANGGTTSGWSGFAYELDSYNSNNRLIGILSSGPLTGLSGTVAFTTPENLTGELEFSVSAHNLTNLIGTEVYAQVYPAEIVLVPNEPEYQPGDTVVFSVQTYGPGFATATIYETVVVTGTNSVLSSSVVVDDSFSVVIPTGTVPDEITASVTAQSPTLGVFATGSTVLREANGLSVNVGISTVSHYSDGSFQPGQTLTVTWSEQTYGTGTRSVAYYVELWNANGEYFFGDAAPLADVLTNQTSGSFQYTIPSGNPAGAQALWVTADAANGCNSYCYGVGQVSYQVNPNPSALNYELGAGSGITVGWLILLVIIIVVALLLVLMIRRDRFARMPSPTYTSTTQPMSPPAPAPSSPPATEWSPSTTSPASSPTPAPSDGDAPPPLPTPPSGPQ
jgi:hypothetical protein